MKKLEEKIYEVIKKPNLSSFATVTENGEPWIRYVMAVGDKDLTIRFSTFIKSRKVSQIKECNNVHLICGINNLIDLNPYLQVKGKASIVTSQEEKNRFWNDELKNVFSGPDDPNYALIFIKPVYIEYTLPKTPAAPEIWKSFETV